MNRVLITRGETLGSTLLTTVISRAIKSQYINCEIDWVTSNHCVELLKHVDSIDNIYVLDSDTINIIKNKKYDVAINFSYTGKTYQNIISKINTQEIVGFVIKNGNVEYFSKGTESLYVMWKDWRFRKTITKSLQQIYIEALGMVWNEQMYDLKTSEKSDSTLELLFTKFQISDSIVIGINAGSNKTWPNKQISPIKVLSLLEQIFKFTKKELRIILLGGKNELERNKHIKNLCDDYVWGGKVINFESEFSITHFISLVKQLDCLITTDSFSLHLGNALKIPTIGVFGPTSNTEIYGYNHMQTISSPLSCSPCYAKTLIDCSERDRLKCMDFSEADLLNKMKYYEII